MGTSRFSKMKNINDNDILKINDLKENENINLDITNDSKVESSSETLNFQKLKKNKKKDFALGSAVKKRATINITEATRNRLKIFCAINQENMESWADETIWRAIDKAEKAKEK